MVSLLGGTVNLSKRASFVLLHGRETSKQNLPIRFHFANQTAFLHQLTWALTCPLKPEMLSPLYISIAPSRSHGRVCRDSSFVTPEDFDMVEDTVPSSWFCPIRWCYVRIKVIKPKTVDEMYCSWWLVVGLCHAQQHEVPLVGNSRHFVLHKSW